MLLKNSFYTFILLMIDLLNCQSSLLKPEWFISINIFSLLLIWQCLVSYVRRSIYSIYRIGFLSRSRFARVCSSNLDLNPIFRPRFWSWFYKFWHQLLLNWYWIFLSRLLWYIIQRQLNKSKQIWWKLYILWVWIHQVQSNYSLQYYYSQVGYFYFHKLKMNK